ncbi:MAG: tetratricopeptide repeat protein [Vampirovibrionales bacterium]
MTTPFSHNVPSPSNSGFEVGVQVIDRQVRFSQCIVWDLLEDFYRKQGINAWKSIPYGITNTVAIADTYAQLFANWLADHVGQLDKNHPIYAIEAAAGVGQFGYFFVRQLQHYLAADKRLVDLNVITVITDFAQSIIDEWQHNEKLAPFIKRGQLDIALFSPEYDQSLCLQHANKTLKPDDFVNPCLVIGNYFFDSLRQDFFKIIDHRLHEVRVNTYRHVDTQGYNKPLSIASLMIDECPLPLDTDAVAQYYPNPVHNHILAQWAKDWEHHAFELPVGAFQVIENLRRLTNDNLLLLMTDKGDVHPGIVKRFNHRVLDKHGEGFSFPVNFLAIQQLAEAHGGHVLLTHDEHLRLRTCWMDFSPMARQEGHGHNTTAFFERYLQETNLLNQVFSVYRWLTRANTAMAQPKDPNTLANDEQDDVFMDFVGILQLCQYDPWALQLIDCYIGELALTNSFRKHLLFNCMQRVEANLYPSRNHIESYFLLATLYKLLDRYEDALRVINELLAAEPDHVDGLLLKANLYHHLGNPSVIEVYHQCLQAMAADNPMRHDVENMITMLTAAMADMPEMADSPKNT